MTDTQTRTQAQAQSTIPNGYWQDAHGNLVPLEKVKPIDKLRDETVRGLFANAQAASQNLQIFKASAMAQVDSFVGLSAQDYGLELGGKKGNVTLFSFDGSLKVQRAMQESIAFDERLQVAKGLIDQCVTRWAQGINDNIRVLINHAFQVDKEGKVSVGRILGLRRLDIKDGDWLKAMQAISDSMQTVSSKAYIRFYERRADGSYAPLSLDIAGAKV